MVRLCVRVKGQRNGSRSRVVLRFGVFLLAAVSFFCPAQPNLLAPAKRQKLRVHDPALAQQLAQQGAELIADYGSFRLFRVDDALARDLASHPGAENANHQNVIALNARPLDTTTPGIAARRNGPGAAVCRPRRAPLEQTGV